MSTAYANCDSSSGNLNLAECYTAGISSTQTVQSLFNSPAQLINLGVNTIFTISGLILFVLLMYAGYIYIFDTQKGKDQVNEMLGSILKGFLLMFTAYWIVQLILGITGVNTIF
jgi:hypothetical protein